MEELFDLVERGIDDDAAELRVTYHPTLGYPTEAFIDFRENVADEEMGWTAARLEAVGAP